VGPIWLGGKHGEPEQLANCYRSCLALAEQNNVRTIAFPPISIGLYHFPIKKASIIAVKEIKEFLDKNTSIEQVILVSRSERCYTRFLLIAERMFGEISDKPLEMID
jgi:O-acetyl-ADP-ribose deacetylase (regulator of RNase III)